MNRLFWIGLALMGVGVLILLWDVIGDELIKEDQRKPRYKIERYEK